MNVLIIPEDFRNDQYILKPLFDRSVRDRPIHIQICRDPLLGGIGEALKLDRISEVMDRYEGMIDVFVLCVDRDGEEGRRQRLDDIESEFGNGVTFLAENAWEEVETWLLAGLDLPSEWSWADVRAEVHVKETYFEPLVAQRDLTSSLGGGRDELGREAARQLGAIRQKCPEFDELGKRLESAVGIA